MQKIIDYIQQFVKLNEKAVAELEKLAEIEKYAKNQYILEPGKRCNKIWFIVNGMVRKFAINDGKEFTSWIYTENETFTSLQSYAQKTVCNEYLQTCEETELISITRENSKKLARFSEFVEFSNALMEKEFVKNDLFAKAIKEMDASGKYDYLKEVAPEMVKRAKLGHIASIIGITQETLSRIRKK